MRMIMCRLIGIVLFWIGIGMLLMLFISSKIVSVLLIATFLIVGYNLYHCKR